MKPRLLDTQKAKELGPDGTSKLEGPWAITTYTNEEWVDHGLRMYPADTTFLKTDSWPDFILKFSDDAYALWEWKTASATWQIQHYVYGFGEKAPCGHTATIMVSGGDNVYYLCDRFHTKNTDMSNFTAVIEGKAEYPFTGDTCLGKTCKVYQELKNSDSTSQEKI